VPDALDNADEEDGFLPPDRAAARMGIGTSELLRLAGQGVLATRGRGYGLVVRPALLSGAMAARLPTIAHRLRVRPPLAASPARGGVPLATRSCTARAERLNLRTPRPELSL
jgi:hypothetical protein